MTRIRPGACLAFGLLLCGSMPAHAWAGGLPRFDIHAVCTLERNAGPGPVDRAGYRGCLSDERAARRILKTQWHTFRTGERRVCRAESMIGGAPSYVALLTCLQLDSGDLPTQPAFHPSDGSRPR
ncbi:hypothetical protein MKK88_21950 [Methylobacterium sp. E-005]|uniref:hypothetical protein n=1 Tax=Methylobacterium sp. E-005 TaxID=2836549 RepID=UPI001FBAC408|nr:hypothetical protein [Methylobacterium sp. E-005]MCJ2088621.1 hypothetical protein [Methylobacterium sp. E-005]